MLCEAAADVLDEDGAPRLLHLRVQGLDSELPGTFEFGYSDLQLGERQGREAAKPQLE